MKAKRNHPCYENKNFNPLLRVVNSWGEKNKIAVVHVGKCAGESVIRSLKKNLPSNHFDIFEYHCFDANRLLSELVNQQHELSSVYFVICTRDPLERWISSFNWDLHNIILSKSKHSELHKKYPNVHELVEELCCDDPDEDALKLSRFGHMGMGISWYLPYEVFCELPHERTYCVRTENIDSDLSAVILRLRALAKEPPSPMRETPKTKDDYKSKYPAATFGGLDKTAYGQIKKIKKHLDSDYAIHELAMKFIA